MMQEHELMTRMLFIDAIVGVGFPHTQVAIDAERGGLATYTGNSYQESYAWNRRILETLTTPTLQDMYTGLKLQEVSNASQH